MLTRSAPDVGTFRKLNRELVVRDTSFVSGQVWTHPDFARTVMWSNELCRFEQLRDLCFKSLQLGLESNWFKKASRLDALFTGGTCRLLFLVFAVIHICHRPQLHGHPDQLLVAVLFRINRDAIPDFEILE